MQLPDSSVFYNTISRPLAAGALLSLRKQSRGIYFFPYGNLFIERPLNIQGYTNLSLSAQEGSFNPYSISFGSSPLVTATLSGSTVYTLNGKSELGDPVVLSTATVTPVNSPVIKSFSAITYSNEPSNPLQVTYQTQNATNITITSSQRALTVPSDAFEGTLVINNPQDGEVITLVIYDANTNQTEQIQITVDNSEKVFLCDIKDANEMGAATEAMFYGSEPVTLDISDDDTRLYCGRSNGIPAIIYLNAYPIQSNNVLNMLLSNGCVGDENFTFESYISNGIPNILSFQNDSVYFCQPGGYKVTLFNGLTQIAESHIDISDQPTNIEVNDNLIVVKTDISLLIFDKTSNTLLQEFILEGNYPNKANDKEIFISSQRIFYLDNNKVKSINLLDLTQIEKEITFDNGPVFNAALAYSENRNELYIIYAKQTKFVGQNGITEPEISIELNVISYQDEISTFTKSINKTDRGDTRIGLRIEKDEERIFILLDRLNSIYAFSLDPDTSYKQVGFYNLLKPYGIALSNNGKHLYYTAQTENSYTLNTQKPRSLIVLKLFETKLNVEIL